jgi:hypothetical protein
MTKCLWRNANSYGLNQNNLENQFVLEHESEEITVSAFAGINQKVVAAGSIQVVNAKGWHHT